MLSRTSADRSRRLDERFAFDPPGRVGGWTDKATTRERAYDERLRELFGPATDVLVDAPNVFSRLGIVDHRLYALTAVDAAAIEAAADLLLSSGRPCRRESCGATDTTPS